MAGVIKSIIDDAFELLMPEEWRHQQQASRISARIQAANEEAETKRTADLKSDAGKCWNMAAYGNGKAEFYSKQKDHKRALAWKTWAHHKELEAEYYESQI